MRRLSTAALLASAVLVAPIALVPNHAARAQIGIGIGIGGVGLNVTIAPPALPVYEPPPLPGPGYIFTPGYWAYGDAGYYWVPGVWVQPPTVGVLWTPGYWGWNGGHYLFNAGYWGPHVGYYGGIDYGFGYTPGGYFGGEWRGGAFAYNEAAYGPHFFNGGGGYHVTNVYNRTIINNTTINRTSFNGPNGIQARPTPQQEQFAHEQHVQPTPMQQQHFQAAAHDRSLLASENHGHPAIAAVARPAVFHGPGVVPAREAVVRPGGEAHPALQPHAAEAAARPGLAARPGEAAREGVAAHPGQEHPALVAHQGASRPAATGGYHPAAERAAPERAAPERAAPERAAPERAAPERAAPERAAPEHAAAMRPEAMARPAPAPHPMAAPRPAAAPHPAGHPEGKDPHKYARLKTVRGEQCPGRMYRLIRRIPEALLPHSCFPAG
jgi:hypothetical protein